MAIVFKKALCKNVTDKSMVAKYHPQLLTLGQSVGIDRMAYQMKENSSLSKGDILSVIAYFVECMRTNLYNGHSVNIRDFGVFSLSARTEVWKRKRIVRRRRFGRYVSISAPLSVYVPTPLPHVRKMPWSL